jgi:predicted signal transduction protein with EAL and GGDEF domain
MADAWEPWRPRSLCLSPDAIRGSGAEAVPSGSGQSLPACSSQLGKTLKIETLAEGIEDHDQLRQLQREQCDQGQGFLFARPLDAGAMEAFLTASRDAHATSQGRVSDDRTTA